MEKRLCLGERNDAEDMLGDVKEKRDSEGGEES